MIRNDLKEKLGEDWRSKFSHRDCDQAEYEFGEFEVDGKKIELILNPKTLDIMDWYYDDFGGKISINEFIKSMGYEEKDNRKYYIDRDYNFYSNDNLRYNLLSDKTHIHARTRYPEIGITCINKDGCDKVLSFNIHRLIAFIFVPNKNPEIYNIVNHKNRDSSDFSKENLEWCSINENNSQDNKLTYELKLLYRRLSYNKVFTPNELKKEYKSTKSTPITKIVSKAAKNNSKYDNSNWEVINIALSDYISRHPIEKDGWHDDNKLHNFGKFKVRANNCGVLEINGKLTVGHFRKDILTYTITINNKAYLLSRLVYEIINHKIIEEGMVVDHIKPSTKEDVNNSIYNLREVTQLENMQNSETRKRLSKSIISFDLFGKQIKEYSSEDEAVEDLKVHKSAISRVVSGDVPQLSNIIFLEANNKGSLKSRTDYIYYRVNKDGIFESANIHFSGVLYGFTSCKNERDRGSRIKLKYLNTGMPAPDGYYYQQGSPGEMILDKNNEELVKKRPEIFWKYKQRKRDRDKRSNKK